MKFIYKSSGKWSRGCLFKNKVAGIANHNDSLEESSRFHIQTGSFFHKIVYIQICDNCLAILEQKFKINMGKDKEKGCRVWKSLGDWNYAKEDISILFGNRHVSPKPEHKKFIESIYNAYNDNNFDNQEMEKLSSYIQKKRDAKRKKQNAEYQKWQKESIARDKADKARKLSLQKKIKNLLKKKNIKMPASDIDAHLKHQDVEEIREICEELYHKGKISRTGNYRYFILSEEKKKKKPAKAEKSETIDIEKELEKYKSMLDKGLIDKEDYKTKKNELLGL